MAEPMKRLLRPDEAAALLTISPRTLWTLTSEGKIPAVRLGRSVRYDVRDLEHAIEKMKTAKLE